MYKIKISVLETEFRLIYKITELIFIFRVRLNETFYQHVINIVSIYHKLNN